MTHNNNLSLNNNEHILLGIALWGQISQWRFQMPQWTGSITMYGCWTILRQVFQQGKSLGHNLGKKLFLKLLFPPEWPRIVCLIKWPLGPKNSFGYYPKLCINSIYIQFKWLHGFNLIASLLWNKDNLIECIHNMWPPWIIDW